MLGTVAIAGQNIASSKLGTVAKRTIIYLAPCWEQWIVLSGIYQAPCWEQWTILTSIYQDPCLEQ